MYCTVTFRSLNIQYIYLQLFSLLPAEPADFGRVLHAVLVRLHVHGLAVLPRAEDLTRIKKIKIQKQNSIDK